MTTSVCSLSTEWKACLTSGMHPDSAKWMVSRKVKAVGLDTASLDYGQSKDFQSRKTLFKENIPGYVNLANLDKLPSKGATVFAMPMKITRGTGGPLGIFAKLGGECPTTGAGRSLVSGHLRQIITLLFKFLM